MKRFRSASERAERQWLQEQRYSRSNSIAVDLLFPLYENRPGDLADYFKAKGDIFFRLVCALMPRVPPAHFASAVDTTYKAMAKSRIELAFRKSARQSLSARRQQHDRDHA
jgi:hypothetical protein